MKSPMILAALAYFSSSTCLAASLQISAVYDGPLSGGVPKGIAVYANDDIDDLSQYGIGSANNGGGTDGIEFTFPADTIAAGTTIYIASEAVSFTQFFGFAPNYTSSAMAINGDDAVELFYLEGIIDRFGNSDEDGSGTAWEYMDGWAFQKAGRAASTSFNASDWDFSGANAWDNETSNSTAQKPLPVAGITPDPGDNNNGEDLPVTLISVIQGTPATQISNFYGETDVSPLIGEVVAVEAVVVGDFQPADSDNTRNLDGFYIQEETADADSTPLSSEGIFIFAPDTQVDVNIGDKVRIVGEVDQYYGETQLSNIQAIAILGSGFLDSVTPARIALADIETVTQSQNGHYQPDLEAYEGMLVTIAEPLTITEQYQLDRFNEIRLSSTRPYQFTQLNTPNPDLYLQWQQKIGAQTIIYDDGLNEQNKSISFLFGDYNEAKAPRLGDRVDNLTGVLDYKWAGNSTSGAHWRIRAHQDGINTFTNSLAGNSPNPRPQSAPEAYGNLKITSFNVLNLFATLDIGDNITGAGHDPRGADSQLEFDRQLSKIVNAIAELNPDIAGLIELENDFDLVNDGSTAIELLVNALNERLGNDTYTYVYPGQRFVGTDAIATGIIYKPSAVRPAPNSSPALLDDTAVMTLPEFAGIDLSSHPIFNGNATNRVSLAASFVHQSSGDIFTLAVNHFKSKGASGLEDTENPNFDKGDGAGFWNQRRLDAAKALVAWLKQAPTGISGSDVVILGDLNAYAMEEPVQYLLNSGFNDVADSDDYSYVFDGQIGTLDYMLVSDSLRQKLNNAGVWHINADEADALDYNLDYGRDSSYFNASTPIRSSDHDPVIAGFTMESEPATPADLLALLNTEFASKSITGNSRFPFVALLMKAAFYGITEEMVFHFERGHSRKACTLLALSESLSDAKSRPRDLIKGTGVSAFNQSLRNIKQAQCSQFLN